MVARARRADARRVVNRQKAKTGQKALILASSVPDGASSLEATNATGHGFTITSSTTRPGAR